MKLPYTFYHDVDKTSKYIVASDTDSEFINISSIKPKDVNEALEKANMISKDINQTIKEYYNNILLPKLGVKPEHNHTSFKTELILDAMLLLDAKKNYVSKIIAKEGVIFKEADIKATGIPVVRSDFSKFTKDFIKELINSALDRSIERTKLKQHINQIAKKYHEKLQEDIDNYYFDYIGVPLKWGTGYKDGTTPWQVTAMKLYNTIIEDAVFTPMSAGFAVPIIIPKQNEYEKLINPIKDQHERFLGNIPFGNLTKLAIPYGYDKQKIKNAMIKFGIEVNKQEAWEVLYSTSAQRIVEVIKKYSETK